MSLFIYGELILSLVDLGLREKLFWHACCNPSRNRVFLLFFFIINVLIICVLFYFVFDTNGSWKCTLDAIVNNHWLFKVPELEMTPLLLVFLLILWTFKIYFLEGKFFWLEKVEGPTANDLALESCWCAFFCVWLKQKYVARIFLGY